MVSAVAWVLGCGAVSQTAAFGVSKPTQRLSARPVSYLSEVEEEGKEKRKGEEPSDPRDHALYTESINEGPANYEGFIDSEGFDGGDGQVGVVGASSVPIFEQTGDFELDQ